MNESMIGEKNQPPGGLNPAFPSGASAAWETPAQQARRRAKEHQRLHGFASLLAAVDALLSGGTTFLPDVRPALERLRDDPREQLAAEIEFVISEQPDLAKNVLLPI